MEVLEHFILLWKCLLLAALSGACHLSVSLPIFLEETQRLPFFQPLKSFGFVLWINIQILLPGLTFWIFFSLGEKTEVDIGLILKSVLFGFAFANLANSSTPVLPASFSVKTYYDTLVFIAIRWIEQESDYKKNSSFWHQFREELKENNEECQSFLSYLKTYVEQGNILSNLWNSEARSKFIDERLDEIKAAEQEMDRVKKAELVVDQVMLIIRRRDLPEVLNMLSCSKTRKEFFEN